MSFVCLTAKFYASCQEWDGCNKSVYNMEGINLIYLIDVHCLMILKGDKDGSWCGGEDWGLNLEKFDLKLLANFAKKT